MSLKVLGLLVIVAAFMDPCDKKPRSITLKEVPEACSTEVGRMYVRVKAPLQQKIDITCGDAPGGRRCELFMGSSATGDELQIFIRGGQKSDGLQQYQSTLIAPKGTSKVVSQPYKVFFDEAKLYDRNGNVVDHINGPVDVAGSLQLNKETGRCSLSVLHVESSNE
jgi:hypothetical protein